MSSGTIDASQPQNEPAAAHRPCILEQGFSLDQGPTVLPRSFCRCSFVDADAASLGIYRRAAGIHESACTAAPRPSQNRLHPVDIRLPVSIAATARAYAIEDELRARRDAPVPGIFRKIGNHGSDTQPRQFGRTFGVARERVHAHSHRQRLAGNCRA